MRSIHRIFFIVWYLLLANTTLAYTRADTLRGSNGSGRSWWDVTRYDLSVTFDTAYKSITGTNTIRFKIISSPNDSMQIDLQDSMQIDKILWHKKELSFTRDGNVFWVKCPLRKWKAGNEEQVIIYYHGTPRKAMNPPWDGGFVRTKDQAGMPWIAVACQGLGASAWWPCKDVQWDEPDSGMHLSFTIPAGLKVISNGRPDGETTKNGMTTFNWLVKNPINNYDATFYIGDYVHWHDTLQGEKGVLDLDFYVLRENEEKAHKQFAVVKPMLHCFEYWMGPYPFYEDGYKLVDAPYLGMEHQSAVAYGNQYKMGYLGVDRSFTGVGLLFDYIIVHESGHEWFGNSITAKDIADNWIHEGITTYSETLFADCMFGKEKAEQYCRGERINIRNDKPIIGVYGVNEEGSDDMYDKGANMMQMIRLLTNDDEKFRQMLRGLSRTFYHQTVTTQEVEGYIGKATGLNLKAFFDQYLRTADIPEIEYYIKDDQLFYHFDNTVKGFTLPVKVTGGGESASLQIGDDWQHTPWQGGFNIQFARDFLVKVKS